MNPEKKIAATGTAPVSTEEQPTSSSEPPVPSADQIKFDDLQKKFDEMNLKFGSLVDSTSVTRAADFILSHLKAASISSTIVNTISINEHFHVPITITRWTQTINVAAMINSGASTLFINKTFVNHHQIPVRKYSNPIKLLNIDGTENEVGSITEYCVLQIEIRGKSMEEVFTVAGIGKEDIIIGIDWLRHHDPKISFKKGVLEFPDHSVFYASATGIESEEDCKIQEKLPERYWK